MHGRLQPSTGKLRRTLVHTPEEDVGEKGTIFQER